MNFWLIIKREMMHKKVGVITGILSLSIATAGFVGALIILDADAIATEQLFIEKERELQEEMLKLEDDYRIIMRNMGYNVLIINKDQSLSELERNGYASGYFDFEEVWKIANSGITTLNHLLPILQGKIFWKEKGLEILLSGIQGQIPVVAKPGHLTTNLEYRSPIMERIPDGNADLGEELALTLKLQPGDKIILKGEEFKVNRIYPRKGTKDDFMIWIPLNKAQSILGKPGKINGILALECVCAIEEIGQVRKDVLAVLPSMQVFEFSSLIAARADVRKRAANLHEDILKSERTHQAEQRQKKESLASVIIILLMAGASIWIFILILNNVRERKQEIGILRAIGFSRLKVLKIFLGKSLIMGVLAGIIGSLAGLFLGILWSDSGILIIGQENQISSSVMIIGFLLAPILAFTAGLLPSIMAANQDPADILNE